METVARANDRVTKCEQAGKVQADEEPEKPTLGDYVTAKYICGTFRGRYTSDGGGIVVIYRDEYYVIKGADVPVFNRVCGYVDEDGLDIQLDNGHSAKQMKLLDSLEYKEAVKYGRESYAAALNTYKEELARWKDGRLSAMATRAAAQAAIAALPGARMSRQTAAERLDIDCLAENLATSPKNEPASPPSSATPQRTAVDIPSPTPPSALPTAQRGSPIVTVHSGVRLYHRPSSREPPTFTFGATADLHVMGPAEDSWYPVKTDGGQMGWIRQSDVGRVRGQPLSAEGTDQTQAQK